MADALKALHKEIKQKQNNKNNLKLNAMKLKPILLGFFGLGLLASCSNEDIVPGGGSNAELKPDGYIAVKLQLPTVSGTRADEGSDSDTGGSVSNSGTNGSFNDQFIDGYKNEYAVNSGIIVLFQSTKDASGNYSEDEAVFCGAYDLGFPVTPETENDGAPNITNVYTRSVQVTGLNRKSDDKIFGLVLLNYGTANIKLTEGSNLEVESKDGKVKFERTNTTTKAEGDDSNESASTTTGNKTFKDLRTIISNQPFYESESEGSYATGIFMSNSPLSDKRGDDENPTGANITTLVDVTNSIEIEQAEAEKHAAGPIHVERGVAKITCSKFAGFDGKTETKSSIKMNDGWELYITDVHWTIGNEEGSSYLVRNIGDEKRSIDWTLASTKTTTDLYRMISGASGISIQNPNVDSDGNVTFAKKNYYRPYWCFDPNYNKNKYSSEKVKDPLTGEDIWEYAITREYKKWELDYFNNSKVVFYPHENTFDVENMTYGNTTRICFQVKFTLKKGDQEYTGTFYTRNNDKETLYLLRDVNKPKENPLYVHAWEYVSKDKDVIDAFKAALNPNYSTDTDGEATFDVDKYIDIETEIKENGLLVVKSISFNAKAFGEIGNNQLFSEVPEFNFKSIIDDLNANYQYREYKDGNAFYSSKMIKHFGDDLTPWTTASAATTVEESYGSEGADRDNNYLGRYGLVRNNWYDVQVNNVLKLGDPRDPAIWDTEWPKTPDDNNEQYLAIKIAILSWAKRIQEIEL